MWLEPMGTKKDVELKIRQIKVSIVSNVQLSKSNIFLKITNSKSSKFMSIVVMINYITGI